MVAKTKTKINPRRRVNLPPNRMLRMYISLTQKWKYDFMVQFLSGPLWKTRILDFVDYHCVVFDSEEENKFEYTTIHNVHVG